MELSSSFRYNRGLEVDSHIIGPAGPEYLLPRVFGPCQPGLSQTSDAVSAVSLSLSSHGILTACFIRECPIRISYSISVRLALLVQADRKTNEHLQ